MIIHLSHLKNKDGREKEKGTFIILGQDKDSLCASCQISFFTCDWSIDGVLVRRPVQVESGIFSVHLNFDEMRL